MADSENGTVGYGRPPQRTQFPKGVSGNPKGRPKGTKSVAKLINNTLYRKVKLMIGGKRRTLPVLEAILLQVTDKAFKGDLQAGKFLVQLSQVAEAITKEKDGQKRLVVVLKGHDANL